MARNILDGAVHLDGKIYLLGGWNDTAQDLVESYAPDSNKWTTHSPMSTPRHGMASAVSNGKIFAIGGEGLSSVEVYDPASDTWTPGPQLPSVLKWSSALSIENRVFLIGGEVDGNVTNQVLELDLSTDSGSAGKYADRPFRHVSYITKEKFGPSVASRPPTPMRSKAMTQPPIPGRLKHLYKHPDNGHRFG